MPAPAVAPLRAAIVTPNPSDGELALGFLAENGIAASCYASIGELGGALPAGAACVVLVEEALLDGEMPAFRQLLEAQPAWSDLPLVLVAGTQGYGLRALVDGAFPNAGNITLLERPLNPLTLVSAVQVALRATARQLEVRDLLERRDQALRLRDEFLAMLAHELRNPLAPMRNAIYLQRNLKIEDEMLAKSRDILDRQVTHLSRMVDDLLDIARLERGKIQLKRQRLDLNAAVRTALEACLPAMQARSHQVRMSLSGEPLPLEADPVRVEQLLNNLILNAAKFTPNGGRIELGTRVEEGMACVSVTDNGIGIPPEMLEAVFNPFIQADQSLARSFGGLGVGLSIARKVVELHGGSLCAHSDGVSKGARFEARLPLAPAAAPAPRPELRPMAPARRRVLVVEDNADIRESLRLVLDVWGHEVMMAATAHEGLATALESRPDVALIDIGLPEMNGYEIARRIRRDANAWARRIKLVAVTGYGQPSDRERARQAGFDGHLLKPVDPETLQRIILE